VSIGPSLKLSGHDTCQSAGGRAQNMPQVNDGHNGVSNHRRGDSDRCS
jgi:hypothetical protein